MKSDSGHEDIISTLLAALGDFHDSSHHRSSLPCSLFLPHLIYPLARTHLGYKVVDKAFTARFGEPTGLGSWNLQT